MRYFEAELILCLSLFVSVTNIPSLFEANRAVNKSFHSVQLATNKYLTQYVCAAHTPLLNHAPHEDIA